MAKPKRILWVGLIFVTLLGPAASLEAQWTRVFGMEESIRDEVIYSISQDHEGNYIAVGYTCKPHAYSAFKDYNFLVLKIDQTGSFKWQRTFDNGSDDIAYSVCPTKDNGYIVAGSTGSNGNDAWIIKLKKNGRVEWEKAYGTSSQEEARCISATRDGGYIVAGTSANDIWVFKLSENGDIQWEKAYDLGGDEKSVSIQETLDNGYIVTGISTQNNQRKAWILKLSVQGKILWQRTLKGFSCSHSVEETNKGDYIMAGHYGRSNEYNDDIGILLFSQDGSLMWQKAYGGDGDDIAYSIQPTMDGGYILTGESESFMGNNDIPAHEELLVIKLNRKGKIQWQKIYGGDYSLDEGRNIQPTMDGGYIVAGKTLSWGAGNCDAWILKLDANGEINPLCKFIKPAMCEVFEAKIVPELQQVRSRNTKTEARPTSGSVQKVTGKIYPLGEEPNVKLTIESNYGGTTDPFSGDHYYPLGSVVSIKSIPIEGYFLDKWLGNVQIEYESSDFKVYLEINLDGNKTIKTIFKKKPSSGEWSGGGGGGGIKSIRTTDNPEALSVVVVSIIMMLLCILTMIFFSLGRKRKRISITLK